MAWGKRFGAGLALALLAGSAAAQISGDAIKIGVLNDQSGPYSDLGGKGSIAAAQLAIDEAGGKVLGKPVLLVTADHQNKPDLAASIARQWYDADGVDLITELTTSSVALAVQQIAAERRKVDIVVGAATSRVTGDACSATGFHWAYDNYALARGTGGALVELGAKSWYFVTVDYAFGHDLEKNAADFVKAAGGKVAGSVRHPLNNADFSSFLLQAQSSGAQVVGLANAGTDTINAIKQAAEFGIVAGGQKLAAFLFTLSEVHGLGLAKAQGLVLSEPFYWDRDEASRALAQKFFAKTGRMPNSVHADTYSAVRAYLKAVEAAGSDDGVKVAAKLRELKVSDAFTAAGTVRADGVLLHDMYLFEVKKPADSKQPWDYFKLLKTIPAEQAFLPLDKSDCPLVKK